MADKESPTPKSPREAKVADAARAQAMREKGPTKFGGFMDFVRTQGIVGLAIGLAIGTQANSTVKALVEGFINPIVSFIVGTKTLAQSVWNVVGQDTGGPHPVHYWAHFGSRQLVVQWGAVLSSLITLIAVAAVIYFVVKGFGIDKLDKKKED